MKVLKTLKISCDQEKDLFVQSTRCNKRSIPSCCTIQLFRRKLQKSKLDFREIESCRCFSKDKERIMKSQSKRVYFMWKTICSLVIDNYRGRWDDVYVLWFPRGKTACCNKKQFRRLECLVFCYLLGNAHHIHNEKSSVGAILDECSTAGWKKVKQMEIYDKRGRGRDGKEKEERESSTKIKLRLKKSKL